MTVDRIRTVALDGAFFAVFGLSLVGDLWHYGQVRGLVARVPGNAVAAMHVWLARSGSAA